MSVKAKNKLIFLVLIFISLSTLACSGLAPLLESSGFNFLFPDQNGDSTTPTVQKNGATGPLFTYKGSGTDTWDWEQGKYTCDTQDDMSLIIYATNEAVIRSSGDCFYPKNATLDCEVEKSDLNCGLVVYGTYDKTTGKVIFDSCNTPGFGNGSGFADVSDKDILGHVTCTFPNGSETHILHFQLPIVAP